MLQASGSTRTQAENCDWPPSGTYTLHERENNDLCGGPDQADSACDNKFKEPTERVPDDDPDQCCASSSLVCVF